MPDKRSGKNFQGGKKLCASFLSLLLTMAMVLSLPVTVNAAAPKEDITILHTNDVHCDYEKYAKVATLHKSADLLVDAGDQVQGGVSARSPRASTSSTS